MLCLKWGTWSSPCSDSLTPCLTGLSLARDVDTGDHVPEPISRILTQEWITLLDFPFLFCHGECLTLFHYLLNIMSVSFQFQFCPLGHVDLKVQPPFSIWWHPPPNHVNGVLEKADIRSHLSHGHHLWKLCAVWNLPLSTRESSLWCPVSAACRE